jgi:hypothetical protein
MPTPPRLAVTYLFSRSCPSHEEGLALLRSAAARAGIEIEVEVVEVLDDAHAERIAFVGSPTYLGGDGDLLPDDSPAHAFQHDACRLYRRPGGRVGPLPDRDDLAGALRDAVTAKAAP